MPFFLFDVTQKISQILLEYYSKKFLHYQINSVKLTRRHKIS